MALSYEPLWRFLDQIHVSKMEFAKRIDISNATLAKLGKNEPVTLTIIEKICNEFHCNIENVVTHIHEKSSNVPLEYLKPGIIVECPCYPVCTTTRLRVTRTFRRAALPTCCVILTQRNTEDITGTLEANFLVAPLMFDIDPESIFDISFSNAQFEIEKKNGYIQLSKIANISSKYIDKIVGKMPLDIIDSINSNILPDLAQLMLKYNITTKVLLYNCGLDI